MELFPLDDNLSALGASMSIVPDQDLIVIIKYLHVFTDYDDFNNIVLSPETESISRGEAEGSVVNSVLKTSISR